ncbi:hypothetical protein Enr13x_11010 [Stieleria neptunia]|uniref:DUF1569 domain-containing protein n=1 Tax=Stieleria neptunia TaxID=2527979 RepID=A0A518HK90_9BACT|nr:DUF1569 domain-containing protein [Stieleria neptunia]QDV41263.1 hypothetical protein Enr13x_11010 [Stieleria neptunia]
MAAEHRKLRFESIAAALAEAERLAASETRTTGQYSLGQIFEHLARTFEVVLKEREMPPSPLPMRVLSRLIRPMVLRKAMTGFKLPSKAQSVLWTSEAVSTEDGLQHLREAYEKFKATDPLPAHVFFGSMTRAQHDALQCRHFEGHLGFVHPVSA